MMGAASRALQLVALLAATSTVGFGCFGPPLVFFPKVVQVGYERAEIMDADLVDLDKDGDQDIVVATKAALHYMEYTPEGYTDQTGASALAKVAVVDALHPVGDDYIARRGDGWVRLKYSGIGSWHEQADAVGEFTPDDPRVAYGDINGDGLDDRARVKGTRIFVELAQPAQGSSTPDGTGSAMRWEDITGRVGLSQLNFLRPARRVSFGDIDGDGTLDLMVVAGRLLVMINNGGSL